MHDELFAMPLSFAQQRLWFLAQLDERAAAAYAIPCGIRLVGALNVAAVQAALDRIVERHEVLRTCFGSVDDAPVQLVAEAPAGFALQRVDLSGHAQPESALATVAAEEARAPFDLERGPLIRGRLLRLGERDHVLLVTMHHIVADGWSMGVLTREFGALYAACLHDRPDPLPPLALQYADYAVWQREHLSGEVLQRQLDFWRAHLSGAPALLELPTDRPRPPVQDYTGATIGFQLDADLSAALKALSRRHRCSLFMTLLASWAVLLSRLSGQDEVVIGTPVANRNRAEIEPLIGFFVNTLALRIDLSGTPSVAQLLAQVHAAAVAAQDHQDLPFEQVVEALNPPRSLDHSPVFQVVFAWNSASEDELELPELQLQPVALPSSGVKFDLELSMHEAGECLAGRIGYATALFDASTVERHLGLWQTLLRGMVTDDAGQVHRLPLLTGAQRHHLLHGWNATKATFPTGRCIHELFEEQASRTPEAIAVVCGESALTYGEMNAQANRLAHQLVALGVRPDTRVALALARSTEWVVAMLATLKAGGAYVPLDAGLPPQRLAFMLEDSASSVLLTHSRVRPALGALPPGLPALDLDAPSRPWENLPAGNIEVQALELSPAHLAYVIYTSGSTGRPKAVAVEHHQLANLVGWHGAAFELRAGDRSSSVAGTGFDAATWETWPPLCAGATLVLPPEHVSRDAQALLEWWHREALDVSFLPTPLAEQALAHDQGHPRLRTLLTGGDRLRPLPSRQRSYAVINNYGPTETTVVATSGAVQQPGQTPHIGRPIANTRLYILDRYGEPVPIGVAGEIHIGGAGVAHGYLNQPELTAERFVPDPFCGEPGARMYKTGDLGRRQPDGTIEFLGRNDHQVKVRGFRIELGEIEARLLAHPDVREAVVLAREDTPGDPRLVAYVVGDESLQPQALRAHLGASLPEYMVPAAYVPLDALPLTPNGKLDRRALPAPEGEAYGRRSYEAPQGEVEVALAAVWAELLGVERVGRHDHFFELGGHSLLAVQLIERMRTRGWQLEVRSLFTASTLAGLAATARAASAVRVPPNLIGADCTRITPELLPLVRLSQDEIDAVVASVPGGAAQVQDIYPLAPLQEGILFHHLMNAEGDAYLLTSLVAFDSREGLDRFLAALQAVIDRHDILRTAIAWQGLAEPVQVVWRHAPLPVEELALDGPDVAAQLQARFDSRHTRIDLRRAPLLRAQVAHDAAQGRWLVCLLHHHLVSDHTTLELLAEEVQAHLAGQAHRLPPPLPFRDFVAQARLGLTREQHEAFFTEMLAGIDEPTAPFGLLDVQGDGSNVREASLPVDPALARQLRTQARRLGVSAASVFHLAWALVLARTSGRDDVVFGTVLFGRMQGGEGAHRVLGMFLNTLPLRLTLDGTGVEQAVRATHARLAQLLHHEHAPLALAQRCSGVPAPAPLFSALLNYRHAGGSAVLAHEPAHAEQAWQGMQMLHAQERTNYPLALSVNDAGDDFSLDVQVDQRIDAGRVCSFMMQALEQLVHALQHAPATPVRTLDVLPAAERAQLLHGWNATETAFPTERCIHELFEEQAARTPEAVAVVCGESALTYGELNAQANRLAHQLVALGVCPDTRVALALARSTEWVVAMLATLKAGGAYVPLDASLPPQRLAFMLEDSAPRVLLTHSTVRPALGTLPPGLPALDLDVPSRPWESLPTGNIGAHTLGLSPAHLAYVIYTSGSTGAPKGVMVAHAGLCNLARAQVTAFGLTSESRVLQFASFSFDACIWEVVMALCSGAALHVPAPGVLAGQELLDVLHDERITHATLPPAVLAALPDAVNLPALQTLVMAGEAASETVVQQWAPGRCLINAYGPTEVTVCASLQRCDTSHQGQLPIGRAIANTRIYILDAHGAPVPIGVTGEIHIGGIGVARGYFKRPDLTAERFVPDPFSGEPGARMYKTGDLGRWQPDGTVEFLGRNDHQVKVRGFRIELGEIEARLLAHPDVREAVVLAREDAPGDPRLVAYVVGDESLQPQALRAHLSASLPEYMVPAAYVPLDALPLTPNGKLDRRALPAPEGEAYGRRSYEAPQGEVEVALAAVWAELLGVERVGRHDHFFELGGHSLLAVQLIERMRARGWHLEVRSLFTAPSLAGLAATVTAGAASAVRVPPNLIGADCTRITSELLPLVRLSQDEIDAVVASVPGGAAQVQDIYPLAPLQEGILFHHLMNAEGDAYLLTSLVAFDSRAGLDRFLAALQAVIDRHDILRTAIAWQGLAEPVQVVWRHAPLPVEELALDGPDVAAQLQARFDSRHTRIDVRQAPLLRVHVAADAAHGQWLLCLLAHHLALDHTTLELLVEEVQAHLAGQAHRLPPPLPFRDFVAQARLGLTREQHEAFFTEMLAGIDEPTAPFGLLDVQGDGSGVREARLPLSAELAAQLRAQARRLGVSAASVFHLAWALVLARTSCRDDVVFGTVLFGRMQGGQGAHRVLGMFLNTLPLRLTLDDTGVEQAVRATHARLAQLLHHEHAPLALAQRCSSVPTPAPLFSALLNYRHAGGSAVLAHDPAHAEQASNGVQLLHAQERSNYPLMLSVNDAGEDFSLDVQVDQRIDAGRVSSFLLQALAQLVHALQHAPATPVRSLDVLPPAERAQLLHAWNAAEAAFPTGRCIHELFEEQAARTPEAVAVVFEDTSLSYAELDARANALAHHLIALGVTPDTRVAIALPRSVEMSVAMLATLKAGGAYVPLDPDYPADRLAFMLADSAPQVLLTTAGVRSAWNALPPSLTVLELDALSPLPAYPDIKPNPGARGLRPAHLAYVIYTSGSTGRPKGVMVEHRTVVNFFAGMDAALGAHAPATWLAVTRLSFDISVLELCWTLTRGHTVVIAAGQERVAELLTQHRITHLQCTPSMARMLASDASSIAGLGRLQHLLVGGEALPAPLAGELLRTVDGAVTNMYGPTETTIWSAQHRLHAGDGAVPIGRALANQRLYILDARRQPVPVGVTGEIHIGGAGVARGYLNRPDLSAERFVPDPFAAEPGARMYRTGDLGRWLIDHDGAGTIEFLGRNDHQVKMRGFRIEPGEIEARLLQHPGVSEAVVLVREDAPGDQRLVAYVTGDDALQPEKMRAYLAAHLPEYMVPAAYVRLDALPLTANGKLDRRALPAPEGGAYGQHAYEAPQGELEVTLAALWSELLGVERVGRQNHFFELGGHSLLAVQLASRLRARLGLEVPLAELFAQPTLAGFAQRAAASGASTLPAIVPASRSEPLPLSFAQQRLWFLAQLDDRASATYLIAGGVRLLGALDTAALRAALDRIVARHEALRTRFTAVDGAALQVIAEPEVGFALQWDDLSGHAEPESALQRLTREEATAAFNLERGPLVRGRLLRLAERDHVLLITMHHIVSDAWSMGVLINELSTLYAACAQGLPDPLPALPIQYADYAVWQRRWVAGDVLQRQLDFWRDHLGGAPALLELPTNRPRPQVQDHAGAGIGFELDAELSDALKVLSHRHGTTLFMTLLASWAALLSRLSGQDEVVIGTPVANRHRAELEPLIGFFINTLALRIDLSGSPTVAELLAQVRTTALAAQSNQDIPFEQVVEALNPQRSTAHAPLCQAVFVMQNAPSGELQLPGLTLQPVAAQASSATTDLWWSVSEAGDRLRCDVVYASALFDRPTIERWTRLWQTLLRAMGRNEAQPVARVPLLESTELDQLVHTWNATETAFPDDRCIHQLFEDQATRSPDAPALVFEDMTLSYAELDARANRLAHHLVELGVRPDSPVALALRRSPAMVVAVLATLKAGGAYLPLDPDYPPERLAFMLEDSRPRVVLTEAEVHELLPASRALMTATVLELDDPGLWQHRPDTRLDPAALGLSPSHLAYVIYTSGSTGAPKGVMVAHAGLCNLARAQITAFGVTPDSRVLQFASFSFDACISEVVMALCSGAALHVPAAGVLAGQELLDVLHDERITHATLPPAVLAALPDAVNLPALQTLVMAGEAASAAVVQQWAPGRCLINAYGPTEVTVCASLQHCDASHQRQPPIGRAIANTRIYILDAHGAPVPIGVTGEIHIGGIGVARGYFKRPELTAERFLPDPFSAEPDARMYKSGDIGRWVIGQDGEGTIEFLGRNDHQVKVRGFRIELGEIEARLLAHPDVREAVVLEREDAPGDSRLVAYVVGSDSLQPQALRAHLATTLPDYMVPAAYVPLDALPLTPNGKLDRRALPVPEGEAYGRRSYEPPQGEVEVALAAVWSELLGVERVGRHDHFFELGGHSLLAVKLIERMRARGWQLEVRSLFTAPTLAGLATTVTAGAALAVPVPPNLIGADCTRITPELLPLVRLSQDEIDAVVASVPGGAAHVQDIYPLAPLQEGIFFHHLMNAEGDAYLMTSLVSFDSREGLDRFLAALQSVIDRHDILRTAIAWQGLAEPVQVVWRHAPLPVEELALDGPDVAGQLQVRFDSRHKRIDVRQAPLLRVHVAADAAHGQWLLCLLAHHLALDHTTLELLVEEVQAHLAGQAHQLPPPLPFRDFVAQARLGLSREQHEAFFTEMLAGIDEPTAPFGLLDVQGDGSGVREARLPLSAELARQLRTQARRLGVSAASVFHLAWALVLARTSGRDDVVFGTVLFGRMQGGQGAHRVLGMFLNTLPLRLTLDGTGVEQAVHATHARLAQLLHHEHAPLALAQRCSGVPAPAPLFSALLNYRYAGGSAVLAHDPVHAERAWDGMQMLHAQERTNYPLALSVNDAGDDFSLDVQVDQRIDAGRVGSFLLQALAQLVHALQHAPATPVRSLDVLPPAERVQLLHGWNATEAAFPAERCIHELFEEQAARTPEAVAVVFEDTSLSYAELDARANRLAHHLIGLGVGPDARVALCIERSVPLVVAILATLKTGAAYVPLDPDYPAERLTFMLADSAPRALITQTTVRSTLGVLPVSLPVLEVDRLDNQAPCTNPWAAVHAENAAYVMYTSGSTGTPKGVVVPHRAVLNLVMQTRYARFEPSDRVAFVANPAFDASTFEMWAALLNGAALVVIDPNTLLQPQVLAQRLLDTGVTVAHLTAGLLPAHAQTLAPVLPRLRYLLTGGDRVDTAAVARIRAHGSLKHLIHCYGPTETTTFAVTHEVLDLAPSAQALPLGRPIANARIYILDARSAPVPVGVAGEIHIGGAGIAHGYLNRPELTAERFVPDPYANRPGMRMYRTGDLGRWIIDNNGDGTIEFLGRNDHQVKIRGFRIEPGEIEARLLQHPAVREAVVLSREDAPGDKRLVAYVIGDEPLEPQALRTRLAVDLPEYMLPAAYVQLDAWPLTPNGKLDRRALPTPEDRAFGSRDYEAPQGELETALAVIWAELLRMERVSRHDHFFELGGHSLLAVTLIERVHRLGWQLDVRSLFTSPTLSGLAATVQTTAHLPVPANPIGADCSHITPELLPLVSLSQHEIDAIVATVPGGAANVQDIYPLAPLQEGILFHHLLASEGDTYLDSSLLSFDTRARLDAFLGALQSVIDRHDVLRTSVVWKGLAEPVQVVWRRATLPIEELVLDGPDVPAQLMAWFDPRRMRIELQQAPLLRVHVAHDASHNRWLLCLLMHHLVGDHTALELMAEEVLAHLAGQAHRLPPPLPFRNFVAQARLGITREQHEAYFTRMLSDIDEPTAPFGLLDVQGNGSQVHEAHLPLPIELARQLRAHARRLGVSAASLFHLAWALVLARTTGRNDVVFGTVLFGRMQGEGAHRVLGLFMNTLPIRLTLDDVSAIQAVHRTHARLAQLLHHEHAPLALAQRCSGVPAPAPLFSALLNYRYAGGSAVLTDEDPAHATQAWDGMQQLHARERTNYPLDLSVNDAGEHYSLDLCIDRRIDAERVAGFMLQALEQLAHALQHAPDTPVRSLDVLPPAERAQLLHGWNAAAAALPAERCIHELFEEQAARTPEAIAVIYNEFALTYGELNTQANRLARHLVALGVRPDTCVAVSLSRGPAMVLALLATWKAGGVYVPLDPDYPAERLVFMLADSAPRVVLTDAACADRLPAQAGVHVVWLDEPEPAWASLSAGPLPPSVLGLQPRHLAYVMYTSGSTGAPKGVMIEHRSLVSYTLSAAALFGVRAADRVLQQNSINFDLSLEEMLPAFATGACLELSRAPMAAGGPPCTASVVHLTAAHWHALVSDWHHEPAQARAQLHGVRLINVTGDALSPQLLLHWGALGVTTRLINTYGPTETTVSCTAELLHADPQSGAEAVTIGRPLPGARIYVLDSYGQPAPIGVAGELCVGGLQVGRGYLARPDITAERFVPDPYSADPGSRLYRSGDLARWMADGTIGFLGRRDHQVKVRGFRIELGEIEAALLSCPGVREAVVLAREDAPGDKRLVAYYTTPVTVDDEAMAHAQSAELRAHLAQRLPEYMVPGAYMRLDALPLTPNGKLDRRALPAPQASGMASAAYEAPQGALEQAIAEVWAALLALPRIGRHDDFFALGGHSLLAVQLSSRLRTRLGLEVPLAVLFAQPTLAAFAVRAAAAEQSELPSIVRADRNEPLPLSFAQQRLWFLAQLDAQASTAYHMAGGVRLRGAIDRAALQAALDRIVERHEVLRTSFVAEHGTPRQVIHPAQGFALAQGDVADASDPEAALVAVAHAEATEPFDLARGPLVRGRLVRLAEAHHVLLLTMHHLVTDGWSIGLLINELSVLYAAFRTGGPDPLPPLPIQYADYAVWQKQWLTGARQEAHLDFWRQTLAGAPVLLELPTDRPRPAVQDFAGATVSFELDATTSAGLKTLSARHGTTAFMTLLTAWAALLARLSGRSDLVIGTPVAGRTRTEVEPLIGFFVNTLALRIDLSGSPSVTELLRRVRATTLAAQAHQDLPFEQVIEAVQPVRSLAHSPLCQVMFSSDNTPAGSLDLPGLQLEPVASSVANAHFDLSLEMQEAGTQVVGQLTYATALFDRTTIDRYIGHFTTLLRALATDDARLVDDLPVLDADERRQLEIWNATAAPSLTEASLHALFEAQARRTPDAIALVDEHIELTYAELDARANALARRLRAENVRFGQYVVTVMARSAALVVAQLAILKTGAAYVPIDIESPAPRQALLAQDCGAAAVLHAPGERPAWAQAPCLEVDALATPDPAEAVLQCEPAPASIAAYVMYTSGSTGLPKGVVVPHRAVVNLALEPSYARFTADDRFAFASNPAFDSSTLEVWGALLSGARIVVVPQATLLDPAALATFARGSGLTMLILVAGVLRAYAPVLARQLPGLRYLITGGDVADAQAIGTLLGENAPQHLLQTYGPTETTQFVTTLLLSDVPADGRPIPIGRPIRNSRIYLLDARGQPVPVGMPGELHIGGWGVAQGYIHRPELTAECFVPDPFAAEPGARMYKTGDLGRWRPDGTVEFLGRRDFQVKVRGFRIELGEVEAALQSHPDVREAVVLAHEDAQGHKKLVAYVIADAALQPEALREHLAGGLPDYMVPAAYVQLDALPLTPNGKLDRRALPLPEDAAFGARTYEPPQGDVEAALAAIWAELLGVERVGRHDDFFELGGHSLLAVLLMSRVHDQLDAQVPLSRLYTEPTLSQLARHVQDTRKATRKLVTSVDRSRYYE